MIILLLCWVFCSGGSQISFDERKIMLNLYIIFIFDVMDILYINLLSSIWVFGEIG